MSDMKELMLCEVGDIVTGSTPSTSVAEYWNGQVPFYSPSDFDGAVFSTDTEKTVTDLGASTGRKLIVGSVMVTCIGSIGKMAICNKDGISNQQINTIIPKPNFDSLYLYYLVLNGINRFINLAPQTTIQIINKTEFGKFKFRFHEYETQKKIAKILSTVDSLIEKTQTLMDKYTAIKQGMMADLFTRGIDMTTGDTPNSKAGKLRPSVEDAPEFYKQTELGWVPKEWEVCSLSDCLEFLDSKRIPLKQEDRANMQGHYRYFGASGVIDYVNDYIFDGEFILLGEDGENVLSRNVPLAFKVKGKIWVNNHAHIMVPANSSNIDYFTEYLESLNYENLVSGSAQPKITQNQLAGMLVRVPTLVEQVAIAEKLYSLNKKIEAETAYLEKLRVQKKGLMQDLLTGKVKVQ